MWILSWSVSSRWQKMMRRSSWYETVYLPLVAAIRRSGIVAAFPDRTEADLYLWIMDHGHYLTEQVGHDPGTDAAVRDYTIHFGPTKARRQLTMIPFGGSCGALAPADEPKVRRMESKQVWVGRRR